LGCDFPPTWHLWPGGYAYLYGLLHPGGCLGLEERIIGMGLEQKLGDLGVVTYRLEDLVNWGRTYAMWPILIGLACCAIEMMSTQAAHYDASRFGMELNRPSPRQSDLMIVAGRVSRKMAPVIRRLYDQMPAPKWVIAMGDCASCGGIFNNYAIVQGVDEIIPVDVYVAGCPPRPEALIDGIMTLHEKVRGERIKDWA
jgi:NADH-quinone oxidoreductase subunit B